MRVIESIKKTFLERDFKITHLKLIICVVTFLLLFDNTIFFIKVWDAYPLSFQNLMFFCSLGISLWLLMAFLAILFSSKYTTKPMLIFFLLVSSLISYFMNEYKIVVDYHMLQNVFQTNVSESMDLFSVKMILKLIVFGVIPSFFVTRVEVDYGILKKAVLQKAKAIVIILSLLICNMFLFNQHYASFLREHKPLRYNANPLYFVFSMSKYINRTFFRMPKPLKVIGQHASVTETEAEKEGLRELVILVVGEAARADRFSLNGYQKETNPMLKKEDVISLSNVYSCGTSTAVSVPCMFSMYDKEDYSHEKGRYTENILDVLNHTGKIDILWRDNNSDSKGVALRVPYEDYRTADRNTICDIECRDLGMLVGLDDYIHSHQGRDLLVVLHQMGNHGPAYFKRYPESFEKFKPVCKTNQLEECTEEEIGNAYDNAILYTDYFLSEVIHLLKKYDNTHETAMIYMSDHGESLGENGLYLHGLPYFMAPDEQTHVAAVVWLGENIKHEVDDDALYRQKDVHMTHDNLFHSLLGIFEVESDLYDPNLDILHMSRWDEEHLEQHIE